MNMDEASVSSTTSMATGSPLCMMSIATTSTTATEIAPSARSTVDGEGVRHTHVGNITDDAILQFHDAMLLIDADEREGWTRAQATCAPAVLQHECCPCYFMLACQSNPWDAASRMCLYWKERIALFEERAFEPMTLGSDTISPTGLSVGDVELLETGHYYVLPKDKTGASVLFVDEAKLEPRLFEQPTSRLRALWYALHACFTSGGDQAHRLVVLYACYRPPMSGQYALSSWQFSTGTGKLVEAANRELFVRQLPRPTMKPTRAFEQYNTPAVLSRETSVFAPSIGSKKYYARGLEDCDDSLPSFPYGVPAVLSPSSTSSFPQFTADTPMNSFDRLAMIDWMEIPSHLDAMPADQSEIHCFSQPDPVFRAMSDPLEPDPIVSTFTVMPTTSTQARLVSMSDASHAAVTIAEGTGQVPLQLARHKISAIDSISNPSFPTFSPESILPPVDDDSALLPIQPDIQARHGSGYAATLPRIQDEGYRQPDVDRWDFLCDTSASLISAATGTSNATGFASARAPAETSLPFVPPAGFARESMTPQHTPLAFNSVGPSFPTTYLNQPHVHNNDDDDRVVTAPRPLWPGNRPDDRIRRGDAAPTSQQSTVGAADHDVDLSILFELEWN